MDLIGWIVVALVAAIAVSAIFVYNRLVRLRALAREAFSGINVQLRRRADLVPNLVATVEGYATHERATLSEVIAHRADPVKAEGVAATAEADGIFSRMLGRVLAVAEDYPELKADANFRQLQGDLARIEEELQGSRRYYNATVRDLNTRVQSFPDVLFAGPLGFSTEPYYQDDDPAIRTAPQVRFGTKA